LRYGVPAGHGAAQPEPLSDFLHEATTVRVFNFAAGPATLPLEVLEQARDEMTDWQGSGMSVMEVSHRSKAFVAVAQQAENDLRELMAIPANYKVLFLQGGATGQFTAIPLNLTSADSTADFVNTGAWSKKAIVEAKRFCKVNVVADEAASNYSTVPAAASLRATPGAAYFHYTPNETIGGVEFPYVPDTGDVPLVADMSSTILSRPIDVSRFGVIYAGAQKNIGPSGLVVVIVREDLVGKARAGTPPIWDYEAMAKDGSMLNTPPTFGIYMAGLIFQWLKRQGGLATIGERNRRKAERLYSAIDGSGYYRSPVAPECRSWMNVPFTIPNPQLEKTFCVEAAKASLVNLEGHRSVGGMRASIYNAMSIEGVEALISFMTDFQRRNG
jgi:phosphoserine aminotransferase